MDKIYKIILDDIGFISEEVFLKELLEYSEFITFLYEKLFLEESEKMDFQYIRLLTILPLKRRILRADKLLSKFLLNQNSNIAMNLKFNQDYYLNDRRAIALALRIISITSNASLIALKPYSISDIQKLKIFNKNLQELLASIINHSFIIE